MAELVWNATSIALLVLLATLSIVALGLVVNVVRHARAAPGGASSATSGARSPAPEEPTTLDALLAGGAPPESYCGRVVEDASGARYEAIAVHGASLVLTREGRAFAVPLRAVSAAGDRLALASDADWADAERAGAAWRASRPDAIDSNADDTPLPK